MDYLMQAGPDRVIYARQVGTYAGGHAKVIAVCVWSNGAMERARLTSVRGWFPGPSPVPSEVVPAKVQARIEKHADKLGLPFTKKGTD